MSNLPRWYVPKDGERPPHVPIIMAQRLVDQVGPDPVGGGTVYGGPYTVGEPGWAKAGDWWINLRDVEPQTLAKLNTHPRVLRWTPVAGSMTGHWWNVPVLLTPTTDGDGKPVLYRSALDQHWNGEEWTDPTDLVGLQERLREVALNVAGGQVSDDRALVGLVSDLLMLGHLIHPRELAASGWLTRSLLLRVLIAAADVPLPEADHA